MAINLNSVTIGGNLARDIETRYTQSGTCVGNTAVAVNRTKGKGDDRQEEVTFIDVTLWGKDAENAAQYLHKGSGVVIEGRLTVESWEDRDTGKKRSRMIVTAERVHYGDKGDTSDRANPPREKAQDRPHEGQGRRRVEDTGARPFDSNREPSGGGGMFDGPTDDDDSQIPF